MSNVSETPAAPANQKTTATTGKSYWRTQVFIYDLFVVALLGIFAIVFLWKPEVLPKFVSDYGVVLKAMWFGALGGLVISLKGVYDHGSDWDDSFNLWHVGRPIGGAITGLMTWVLLRAVNPTSLPAPAVAYAIAFIFGTQERRFFNFLFEVAALVVRVPQETTPAVLRVTAIQPAQAAVGQVFVIKGTAFDQNVAVKISSQTVAKPIVTADGTTIAGTVPQGVPAGAVEVTVTNPNGTSVVVRDKLTIKA